MGCMNKEALLEARGRLEAFLQPLLPLLGRAERRRYGALYLQGLLLEGGRKTASGIAGRYGGDVQALPHFVSQSPWNFLAVRRELAVQMMTAASPGGAWIVDDTGFPKKGDRSVGVARQYSGTLGKIGNCQVAVSLNYATDDGCFPVNFELYLPETWAADAGRRQQTGVPEDIRFRTTWQIGLDLVDQARQWGLPDSVVIAAAAYGTVTEFRRALEARQLHYVVGIAPELTVWTEAVTASTLPYSGRGRPRTWRRALPPPVNVGELAQRLPEEVWRELTWRQGTRGPLTSRFAALRVQPAPEHWQGRVTEPICWLLVEWPPADAGAGKYWFANLPEHTDLRRLVYWAKMRWWVEQNYQQLTTALGLDHFEGRSWLGWQHHVTLTMMAFAFLVLEGFRVKKNYWVDPPTSQRRTPASDSDVPWLLSLLPANHHF
jgi:SRSO17 transposase